MEIFRGKILNPRSNEKCDFYEDGVLGIENGKIKFLGEAKQFSGKIPQKSLGVIVPGFCDIHVHWVQNRVKGLFEKELLPWLKEHIWPEESKFSDEIYAKRMAKDFFKDLAKNGTTCAAIYSSIHKKACEIAFEESENYGNFLIGNVLMDMNCPDYLQQNTVGALEEVRELAEKYGQNYVITPRFAPTCSMKLMKEVGEIARQNNLFIQTHLAENIHEIEWVKELFKTSYAEVYEKAGLLSKKTILGHCVHLSDMEFEVLKKSGCKIAHLPTSNIALGSGRMPAEKVLECGIKFALGTDVGAGPFLSMLDVMKAYLEVHKDFWKITAIDALYRATLAGAEILGVAENTGNLNHGKEANFVVLQDVDGKSAEEMIRKILNHKRSEFENLVKMTYFKGNCIYKL